MNTRGEDSEDKWVLRSNCDELVIWQDGDVQKFKDTVLRSFDRRNVARHILKGSSQIWARFAENPPKLQISFCIFRGSAVLFYCILYDLLASNTNRAPKVLVRLRKALSDVLFREAEEIDHHRIARNLKQVAAVPIWPDVSLQAIASAKTKHFRLSRTDDKAVAVQKKLRAMIARG